MNDLLSKPSLHDNVFKILTRVFKTNSEYNLGRDNKKRFAIRKLAFKRFMLGYPPRKKDDNSIGDAINWEWIVDCAKRANKDVIIVTRDNDFGVVANRESFLNDWLKIEFSERVNMRRKIYLTEKLSEAFKWVNIPITKEMIDEENSILPNEPTTITSEQLGFEEVMRKIIQNKFFKH